MNKLDEKQKNTSNSDVDWASHYDYYEVNFRDFYKTVAKPQNDSHYEMLKSKGAKYLKKENTFCEIGFSAGLTLRMVSKHFGKIYGLDISPRNVEFTKKELKEEGYSNCELYTYDLMKFDERFENKFDVISFIHGLEHFNTKDLPLVLNNIKKYLKNNGVFTGALPCNTKFSYRICPKCSHLFEIDGHVSSHNSNSLRKLFEENGFTVIHLDNFNLKYTLKNDRFIKKVYRIIFYYLFNKRLNAQLEYIVQLND